jgi:hypothetical protein
MPLPPSSFPPFPSGSSRVFEHFLATASSLRDFFHSYIYHKKSLTNLVVVTVVKHWFVHATPICERQI